MEFLSKYTLEYIKKKTWNLIFSKVPNFSKVADLSPKKRFRKQWDLIIGVLAGVWPGFFVPKICNPPKHITQKDETSIWSNQNKPPVWLLGGGGLNFGVGDFCVFFWGKNPPPVTCFFSPDPIPAVTGGSMILVASGTECVRLLSATTGPPAEKENAPWLFRFVWCFWRGSLFKMGREEF